jgi:hypothetical protein
MNSEAQAIVTSIKSELDRSRTAATSDEVWRRDVLPEVVDSILNGPGRQRFLELVHDHGARVCDDADDADVISRLVTSLSGSALVTATD